MAKLTLAQLKRELRIGRKLTLIRFKPIIEHGTVTGWEEHERLAREVVQCNTQHAAFTGEKIGGEDGRSYLRWPPSSDILPYEGGFMIAPEGGSRIAYIFND